MAHWGSENIILIVKINLTFLKYSFYLKMYTTTCMVLVVSGSLFGAVLSEVIIKMSSIMYNMMYGYYSYNTVEFKRLKHV